MDLGSALHTALQSLGHIPLELTIRPYYKLSVTCSAFDIIGIRSFVNKFISDYEEEN